MYTIRNKFLEVSVQKTGIEICSLKSVKSGKQYMWDANPEVWESYAPVLFPIIGSLKDDGYTFQGKEYSLPKHGMVRHNKDIELVSSTSSSLTFSLKYSDDTLKMYPFKFEFITKYSLEKNKLVIAHAVINHGKDAMLFSLGGHPAFKCPVNEDEMLEDYFLEFEELENAPTWVLHKNGLQGDESRPVFNNSNKIKLDAHIFDDDALIFKNLKSSLVHLKSNKSDQVLTVEYKGFPYLGIWAKPNARFVCIEPWMGITDKWNTDGKLETKEGILSLKGNSNFEAFYSIKISE
jgi:galactose mutarotase-like enzyme